MLFFTLASAAILLVFPLCAFATSVAEESDGEATRLEKRLSCQAMEVRMVAGSGSWAGSGGTAGLGLDL